MNTACQSCRRCSLPSGRCIAMAILSTPWAAILAARGPQESEGEHRARLATLQADTDAAEGYRLGHAEHCDAFRPSTTSPADERSPRRTA